MSQVSQSPRQNPSQPARRTAESGLCSIVYRSQAVTLLSGYELYELVQGAQARNEAESITGLLLFHNGRFYQWLEGPAANVAKVMASIVKDRRHTNVEILSDKPTATRHFEGWTMRLATREVRSIHSGQNVVVPSNEVIEALNGGDVAAVLGQFATIATASRPAAVIIAPPSNHPLGGGGAALLKDFIVGTVLPQIAARRPLPAAVTLWPIDARSCALADLLIGPDNGAALTLIKTLQGSDASVQWLYETLFEPTARRLGDLWGQDLCSEIDVTLGLGQLQRAARTLNDEVLPAMAAGAFLPAVLVAPAPGEAHSLTASLDSEALWNAGWNSQSEFPSSDEALQDLMAGSWFDALDLSLSAAFRREHWVPRITRTIALARHASRNPALVVVVGGRLFAEDNGAGSRVGADGTSRTAADAEHAIREGLHRQKVK